MWFNILNFFEVASNLPLNQYLSIFEIASYARFFSFFFNFEIVPNLLYLDQIKTVRNSFKFALFGSILLKFSNPRGESPPGPPFHHLQNVSKKSSPPPFQNPGYAPGSSHKLSSVNEGECNIYI